MNYVSKAVVNRLMMTDDRVLSDCSVHLSRLSDGRELQMVCFKQGITIIC